MTPTGKWLRSSKTKLDVYWYLMSPGWPSSGSLSICYYPGDGEMYVGKYVAPIYVSELEPSKPQKFKLSDPRAKMRVIKKIFLIHGSQ